MSNRESLGNLNGGMIEIEAPPHASEEPVQDFKEASSKVLNPCPSGKIPEQGLTVEKKKAIQALNQYLKELNSISGIASDPVQRRNFSIRSFSVADEARNIRDREVGLFDPSSSLSVKPVRLGL